MECFLYLLRTYWKLLYAGAGSAIFAVAVSSSVYFFWNDLFKKWFPIRAGRYIAGKKEAISPVENILAASLAGIGNVLITNPLWVVNVRQKLHKESLTTAFHRTVADRGLSCLYQGLLPSLLLVSNPTVKFLAYEQLSRLWAKNSPWVSTALCNRCCSQSIGHYRHLALPNSQRKIGCWVGLHRYSGCGHENGRQGRLLFALSRDRNQDVSDNPEFGPVAHSV
jgi:hypothetical protein